MSITKEDLLKPLLEFENNLGFKLSQLLGHRAHKWVILQEAVIHYQGIVTIGEIPQEAMFRLNVDEPSSSDAPTVVVSLMVEGEEFNYYYDNSESDLTAFKSIPGLWRKNLNTAEEKFKYYYFEPVSNA
jgi:hypothetical protein